MKSTTIVCMVCGQKVRRTGSNQKYCPECAENVKRENNRHRVSNTGIRAAITPYIPAAPAPPKPKTFVLAGKKHHRGFTDGKSRRNELWNVRSTGRAKVKPSRVSIRDGSPKKKGDIEIHEKHLSKSYQTKADCASGCGRHFGEFFGARYLLAYRGGR